MRSKIIKKIAGGIARLEGKNWNFGEGFHSHLINSSNFARIIPNSLRETENQFLVCTSQSFDEHEKSDEQQEKRVRTLTKSGIKSLDRGQRDKHQRTKKPSTVQTTANIPSTPCDAQVAYTQNITNSGDQRRES